MPGPVFQDPFDLPPPTQDEMNMWHAYWRRWSWCPDRPDFKAWLNQEMLPCRPKLWNLNHLEGWAERRAERPKCEDSSNFPLMALPPEIRCMIYQHAVAAKPALEYLGMIFAGEAIYINARQYGSSTPPLTRVSRLIRQEALPIFYSCNAFHIEVDDLEFRDLYAWLRRLEHTYLKFLKHVQIVLNPPPTQRGRAYVLWLLSNTLPSPVHVDAVRWLKLEEQLAPLRWTLRCSDQSEQYKIFELVVRWGRAERERGATWTELALQIIRRFGRVGGRENMYFTNMTS